MRTPILGILIPYIVSSILFENQTFEQGILVYLQVIYVLGLLVYYINHRARSSLVKSMLNIGCFLILSLYLHFNYGNLNEIKKIDIYKYPQREIILDIKIIKKIKNLQFYDNLETIYFGTIEKTPKFASELLHREIFCSINDQWRKNLRGRSVQIKGVIIFEDINCLNIKRCKLISIRTNTTYSNVIRKIRSYIIGTFEKVNVPENKISGFLNAIFLGNKEMLSKKEKENFQYSGTMHLFAVSGLHVGFLYLIFKIILSSFCKNHKIRELLILLMILIYLELIHYPPSAMRATMMLFVWQCSTLLAKRKNTFSSLFLSCLVLLIIDPSYILSIGFQLSYSVVLSILVYSKISKQIQYDRLNLFRKFFIGSLITSFSAFCGSILLVYDYFNLIVPISIFINLLAVPIAFLFVLTSFIMLVFQLLVGTEIFSHIFYFLYWLLQLIISFCNFEGITYFKILESKNISNVVHFIYPFSFLIYFLFDKRFICKSFLFILIPFLFLLLFFFVI